MFSQRCIYLWYDQFLNTLYPFGALSSRISAPWRVIQRKASRLALNQHKGEVPYADRCKLSKWPSLSDRRNYLSLTECYKFVVWIFMISSNSQKLGLQASTRANHPFKLYVKSARLDCYKYSFFIRIVSKWNDLPRDIVEAESLHHFKNKLHHYLFNKF